MDFHIQNGGVTELSALPQAAAGGFCWIACSRKHFSRSWRRSRTACSLVGLRWWTCNGPTCSTRSSVALRLQSQYELWCSPPGHCTEPTKPCPSNQRRPHRPLKRGGPPGLRRIAPTPWVLRCSTKSTHRAPRRLCGERRVCPPVAACQPPSEGRASPVPGARDDHASRPDARVAPRWTATWTAPRTHAPARHWQNELLTPAHVM